MLISASLGGFRAILDRQAEQSCLGNLCKESLLIGVVLRVAGYQREEANDVRFDVNDRGRRSCFSPYALPRA